MARTVEGVIAPQEVSGGDRVREHTDPGRLATLDARMEARVASYIGASDAELSERIAELERESDIERVLETNASILALAGLLAGIFVRRWLLIVPMIVLGFLLQHAIQGWCPPVPLFRRVGVRTRQEIDAEKSAMKAIRGDFDRLSARSATTRRVG